MQRACNRPVRLNFLLFFSNFSLSLSAYTQAYILTCTHRPFASTTILAVFWYAALCKTSPNQKESVRVQRAHPFGQNDTPGHRRFERCTQLALIAVTVLLQPNFFAHFLLVFIFCVKFQILRMPSVCHVPTRKKLTHFTQINLTRKFCGWGRYKVPSVGSGRELMSSNNSNHNCSHNNNKTHNTNRTYTLPGLLLLTMIILRNKKKDGH